MNWRSLVHGCADWSARIVVQEMLPSAAANAAACHRAARVRRQMANRKRPLVVVTRKLPDSVETRMRELFDARLNLDDAPMSPAALAEAVKSADVLLPTVTDRIDSALLSHAGDKLKLIASFSNGVDHIDVASALQRGITVTNTPGVLTEDTADMTM